MRYTEENRACFLKDAETLAPSLLGKVLCRRLPNGEVIKLKIIDVEAYNSIDSANYGRKNNGEFRIKTEANAPLFEQGGICCVYAGMLLIVCGKVGEPDNVLIRGCADKDNLYDGPIKVAQALKIGMDNIPFREDLLNSESIWLQTDDEIGTICRVKRCRLGKEVEKEHKEKACRFILI